MTSQISFNNRWIIQMSQLRTLIQTLMKTYNSLCRCFNKQQRNLKKILMASNHQSRKLNRLVLKILNNKFRNFKALLRLLLLRIIRILSKIIKIMNKTTIKNRMIKMSKNKKKNKFKKTYYQCETQSKIMYRKRRLKKKKMMMMNQQKWQ